MNDPDPTRRFSSRVENYVRFRPHYPEAVIEILRDECGLESTWTVADIGSGTGFLAEIFLKNGNPVIGIEPNREMREAGEVYLQDQPGFTSVDATAETTTLSPSSIDLIVAGQAFHWFDPEKTRTEFQRILVPGGVTALIWNERRIEDDPVQRDYEDLLLRFGTDYTTVGFEHSIDESTIDRFFTNGWRVLQTENIQVLDRNGLEGRLLSTSYSPEPGSDSYRPMLDQLSAIFDRYQIDGMISMSYWTRIYWGRQ